MKIGGMFFEDDDQELNIRMDAENIADVSDILKIIHTTKKPNAAYGRIGKEMQYVWIKISIKKPKGDETFFESERKSK